MGATSAGGIDRGAGAVNLRGACPGEARAPSGDGGTRLPATAGRTSLGRGEASVEVAAPPNIVWELIADPSRHAEFGTFVAEVQLASPAPIGRGTVYTR